MGWALSFAILQERLRVLPYFLFPLRHHKLARGLVCDYPRVSYGDGKSGESASSTALQHPSRRLANAKRSAATQPIGDYRRIFGPNKLNPIAQPQFPH